MTTPQSHNPQGDLNRVREALADRATRSLSAHDGAAASAASRDEAEAMELAAAAAHLALMQDVQPMPPSLRAKLERSAEGFAAAPAPLPMRAEASRRLNVGAVSGWLAAAAAIVVAVYAWSVRPGPAASPEQARGALLASATDTTTTAWAPWGEGPAVAGIGGDVVWSPSRQEGYMRFRNLSPNDRAREQYQLWIVDATRGEPLKVPPVDGGVFDIPASGEVVVPIRAKLPVGKAVAFAVTVEPPGGVVVSDQSRKVVVAMVK